MKINNITYKNKNFILTIGKNEYVIDDFFYKILYPYINKEIDDETLFTIKCFDKANIVLKKLYKDIYLNTISTKKVYTSLSETCDYQERKEIIKVIKNEGYLNDEKVIEYYMNKYQNNKGVIFFKNKMEKIGIESNLIIKYSDLYVENLDYVNSIVDKLTNTKQYSNAKLKQKIFLSLSNKGFSSKTINNVLFKIKLNDDFQSLKKEYNKIKDKYETQKIISKLLNKGYNISSIKKVCKEDFDYEDN